MTEQTIGEITAAIAILGTLSAAYGKFIGPLQTELVQAIIDGFSLSSKIRPAVNFATGIGLALILSLFLALYVGDWRLIAVGLVAGVFASQKAAETHDVQAQAEQAAQAPQTPPRTFLRG